MKISVVTVSFNAAESIAATVKSVSGQQNCDFEHIIIDGASTDDTVEVAKSVAGARPIILSEPDNGLYDAMNKGLRLASGEFVAFLNADDIYADATVLADVADRAARADVDCVIGDTQFARRDGSTKGLRLYRARHFRPWMLRLGYMPPHPSTFLRREILLNTDGFNTRFRSAADFDLLARIFLQKRISYIPLDRTLSIFTLGGLSTQGHQSRARTSREITESLRDLGQPFPRLSSRARFALKAIQYL